MGRDYSRVEWDEKALARIVRLREEGASVRTIAARIGASKSVVVRLLRKSEVAEGAR